MAIMRHRRAAAPDEDEDDDSQILLSMPANPSKPPAHQLLNSDPIHAGFLMKRSRHVLWHMVLGPRCCKDAWKSRFFILSGTYLFRYTSDSGSKPKGVPLPVDCCSFRAASTEEEDQAAAAGQTPRGVGFVVSTVRKEYHLRADSVQERNTWLRMLRASKQRAIKEHLGHAPVNPKHAAANRAGAALFAKRVQDDASEGAEITPTSVEMSVLRGGGGMFS